MSLQLGEDTYKATTFICVQGDAQTVHSTFVCNGKNLRGRQMPINRRTDKLCLNSVTLYSITFQLCEIQGTLFITDIYIFKFFYLFIFGCAGSSVLCMNVLQLWRAGATIYLRSTGFSLQWLLLLQSIGCRAWGLQQLWLMSLVAPRHVGSSQTRDLLMFPALAGGFLTTGPPRKSYKLYFIIPILLS